MLKSVYLITERNLQISLLEKELCASFRLNILSPIEVISDTSYLNDHIVLLDLAVLKGQNFTQILSLVTEQADKIIIALFNADRGQALPIIRQHQRIRDLFFTDDSFETLVKGTHRLSEGEY